MCEIKYESETTEDIKRISNYLNVPFMKFSGAAFMFIIRSASTVNYNRKLSQITENCFFYSKFYYTVSTISKYMVGKYVSTFPLNDILAYREKK